MSNSTNPEPFASVRLSYKACMEIAWMLVRKAIAEDESMTDDIDDVIDGDATVAIGVLGAMANAFAATLREGGEEADALDPLLPGDMADSIFVPLVEQAALIDDVHDTIEDMEHGWIDEGPTDGS